MKNKIIFLLFSFVMLAIINACGDGNNKTDPAFTPGNTNPGNINGNFKGILFISGGVDDVTLDIANGEYTTLAPDDFEHTVWPFSDGSKFVETVSDCRYISLSFDNDCINIRTAEGRLIASFEIGETLYGAAKPAPRSQIVAAKWSDEANGERYASDARLTLFSWDGKVLGRSSEVVRDFDWLPDERLIYASGQSIFLTTSGMAQGNLLKPLADLEGVPDLLAVSPDGRQVAFTMVTDYGVGILHKKIEGSSWVMDIDGNNLRQLTMPPEGTKASEYAPAWSPDGQWILLSQGGFSALAGGSTNPGLPGALYIIPADGTKVKLTTEEPTLARPVYAYRKSDTKLKHAFGDEDNRFIWLVNNNWQAEKAGSLPPHSNGINRGVSGTVYYRETDNEKAEFWAIDLDNGQNRLVIRTDLEASYTDDLYVSRDSRYFVYTSDIPSGDDGTAVTIYGHDGQRLWQYPFKEITLKGPVKLSAANSAYLLAKYKFYNKGWNKGFFIIDWQKEKILKLLADYEAADWMPDGTVVLSNETGIYQTNIDFTETTLIIPLKESVDRLAVNPQGTHVAFTMAGHLWSSDLSGKDIKRITVSNGFERDVDWSPDGRFIVTSLKKEVDDFGGRYWIVAADAANVRIGSIERHQNAIPLRYTDAHFYTSSSVSWR